MCRNDFRMRKVCKTFEQKSASVHSLQYTEGRTVKQDPPGQTEYGDERCKPAESKTEAEREEMTLVLICPVCIKY